jgi:alpha-beta hydrolase superfamily lysophospholipase
MKTQLNSFTTPDKQKIAYYAWTPESETKGVVLIVHGIGEHAGRYAHVAERWTRDGYAVYAPDHRGHGKSDGDRAHFDNFSQPVSDLRQLFDMLQKEHPHVPFYMYGHSMGSAIALAFALDYQRDLRGLILTGTAITVDELTNGVVIGVAGLVASINPKARLIPALPAETITSDPAELKKYDTDPLNDRGNMRVGILHKLIMLGRDIRARAKMLTLPMLIMHGEDDKLTPISGSRVLYASISSPDKQLLTYAGLRHELVNEVKRDEIIETMTQWLNAH